MPLYEYKCNSCGEVFDVLQKFSDKPLTVHVKCGGKVERVICPPAFHFKGTGWYVTDYGRSSNSLSSSSSNHNGSNGKSAESSHDGKSNAPATASAAKTVQPAAAKS
jgi:putative FmdB family regulatory protein